MTKKRIFALGTSLVMIATIGLSGVAQQTEQDQQKMMAAYMKMMAVNENHVYLKNFVGEWDVRTKAWMQPGTEPVISQNSSIARLILGGRFLEMEFKGEMFGQPFEGLQIVGFDNFQKKYVTFWIDSSSTAFYLLSGTRDESENVITDTGDWPDPVTGGAIGVRAVTKLVSKDEFVYEMYMIGPDGNEFKTLENRAVRKKSNQ
jgi:hypothetical protein